MRKVTINNSSQSIGDFATFRTIKGDSTMPNSLQFFKGFFGTGDQYEIVTFGGKTTCKCLANAT